MHRVFHGIRFKVNKDWTTAVVLFFMSLHEINCPLHGQNVFLGWIVVAGFVKKTSLKNRRLTVAF